MRFMQRAILAAGISLFLFSIMITGASAGIRLFSETAYSGVGLLAIGLYTLDYLNYLTGT